MQPLITIVTPSFNQGPFLERTIRSVIEQDYPHIEYMVIDGGSSDNSLEIIKKYENRLSYWISEKDKGQSDAINKGWKRARGTYCAYLNSDDALAPGSVSKIAESFQHYPEAVVVYGDYTFIDEHDRTIEICKGRQTDFKGLLLNGQMPAIAQPSSFYLTSLVKEVGFIDTSLHLSMDYDLLLKLSQRGEIKYIPEQISFFRLHSNAKSSTLMKKHWHESLKIKMKYNKLYMYKSLLKYFRFRLFHILPGFIQRPVRKLRNSVNDRMELGSE